MPKKSEEKMRETLKTLKSPFYKNSRREKNEALKEVNECLTEIEKNGGKQIRPS